MKVLSSFGGVEVPFVDYLGITLVKMDGGESDLDFDPKPEHCDDSSVVHPGAIMTLLDVAMAVAARSANEDTGAITIEMKATFMQPARGRLSAKGRVTHRDGDLAFVEATASDLEGRTCAQSTGTFKCVVRASAKLSDSRSRQISTD